MGRVIPFCAARSTGPSHNIGINIQQMMSSMKFQRRVKKRHSALTHNSGSSVSYKGGTLSALASAVNARARYIKRQRNRHRSGFKLPQYTRAVKKEFIQQNIHEPPVNKQIESAQCNQNLQMIYQSYQHVRQHHTLMDQDSESSSDIENIESGVNLSRCKKMICIPNSNLELLFISQTFEHFQCMSTSEVSIAQLTKKQDNENDKNEIKYQKQQIYKKGLENSYQQMQGDYLFQGKEKKVKEILLQLHDDFEELNQMHADLSSKISEGKIMAGGDSAAMSKRLDEVEKELTKKEDQIKLIMTLCNEVINLRKRLNYMDCMQQKFIEILRHNQNSTQSSCLSFDQQFKYNIDTAK